MLIPFLAFMLLTDPDIASLVILASAIKWSVAKQYEVDVPICFYRNTGCVFFILAGIGFGTLTGVERHL